MKIYKTIFCFTLCCFHCNLYAKDTILFFDFNNNIKTYKVLKKASESNGKAILKIGNAQDPITQKSLQRWMESNVSSFSSEMQISTIIMSGHHGNYTFSGETGELSIEDLTEVLKPYEKSFNSVKKLILRGCYTVTTETILPNSPWRKLFPNVESILGFEQKAWDDMLPMSYEFVEASLYWNSENAKSLSKSDLVSYFQSIPHQKKSALGIWNKHISAPRNGLFLSTEKGFNGRPITSFEQAIKACDLNYPVKEHHKSIVDEYANGVRDIPKNTSKSPLRDAYNFFNTNNHCFSLSNKWIFDRAESDNQVDKPLNLRFLMSLLFFNNILNNLDNYLNSAFGVNWFYDWKVDLLSDEIIKLPKTFSEMESIKRLSFPQANSLFPDISSITNNTQRPEHTFKIVSQLVIGTALTRDSLIMPNRWMTETNSSAPPNLPLNINNDSNFFFESNLKPPSTNGHFDP